jgi:hypothetical protein
MNPDIKAQWVAALRSGEYQQGRSLLRREECFCCLGVLCDLAVKAGVVSWEPPAGVNVQEGAQGCGNAVAALPNSVKRWAGLELGDPWVTIDGPGKGNWLSRVNDVLLLKFPAIADLIEAQL